MAKLKWLSKPTRHNNVPVLVVHELMHMHKTKQERKGILKTWAMGRHEVGANEECWYNLLAKSQGSSHS